MNTQVYGEHFESEENISNLNYKRIIELTRLRQEWGRSSHIQRDIREHEVTMHHRMAKGLPCHCVPQAPGQLKYQRKKESHLASKVQSRLSKVATQTVEELGRRFQEAGHSQPDIVEI